METALYTQSFPMISGRASFAFKAATPRQPLGLPKFATLVNSHFRHEGLDRAISGCINLRKNLVDFACFGLCLFKTIRYNDKIEA